MNYTPEQLAAMSDRELDAAVAEGPMKRPLALLCRPLAFFRPSFYRSDCYFLKKQMREQGWRIALRDYLDGGLFTCYWHHSVKSSSYRAKSLTSDLRAICEAAVLAWQGDGK